MGEEGPVWTFCGQGGSLVFGAKNFEVFEIYDMSARSKERGVEAVRTFFGKEGREESYFSQFSADVFYS